MVCRKCGCICENDSVFCPNCGLNFKKRNIVAPILIIFGCLVVLGAGTFFGVNYFKNRQAEPEEVVEENTRPGHHNGDIDETGTTIMVYMVGSNLESDYSAASDDIEEMMDADLGENVNVVLQTGGTEYWHMTSIDDGVVQRFLLEDGKLEELDNLGEISMVDRGNLSDFIEFSADEYPAENYILVLWDHGGWIPISFGYDELFPNDFLTDYDIGQAVEDSGVHFDAVVFDACNMCSLEVAMSLKDNVDYLVAAESYVNGIGIYYTDWIDLVVKDPDATTVYCEEIVKDYMDSLDYDGLIGSMSVIDLSKIEDVYEAYIEYIESVTELVIGGDYAGYITARGNCGYYDETDSVDLCTLCSQYSTGSSTNLFNSVVNAVEYTESDMPFGHGITAYSPYNFPDEYPSGRTSFENMDYDETISGFYDMIVSEMLHSQGYDYLFTSYDWYDCSLLDSNSDYVIPDSHLEVIVSPDDVYALELDDMDWSVIDTVMLSFAVEENDDEVCILGSDYTYNFDSYGNLMLYDPEEWYFFDDQQVSFDAQYYYHSDMDQTWSMMGYIYAQVNGVDSAIEVYFDQDNPNGCIMGYYYVDLSDEPDVDDYMYSFEDSDVLTPLYHIYSISSKTDEWVAFDESYTYGDVDIYYGPASWDTYNTDMFYTITDVYGNVYDTEMVGYQGN